MPLVYITVVSETNTQFKITVKILVYNHAEQNTTYVTNINFSAKNLIFMKYFDKWPAFSLIIIVYGFGFLMGYRILGCKSIFIHWTFISFEEFPTSFKENDPTYRKVLDEWTLSERNSWR